MQRMRTQRSLRTKAVAGRSASRPRVELREAVCRAGKNRQVSQREQNRISGDVLRNALLDPHVRKKRMIGRLPGYRVDADDLRRAVQERYERRKITDADVNAAVRDAGGHRIGRGPGDILRAAFGKQPSRTQYWLSYWPYRKATRRHSTTTTL